MDAMITTTMKTADDIRAMEVPFFRNYTSFVNKFM